MVLMHLGTASADADRTMGALATVTKLSTAALTGVVDALVAGGLVRRLR
jgi:DNA-binding MarR family transcriptional regulator